MSAWSTTREGGAVRGEKSARPHRRRSSSAMRDVYGDVRTLASTLEEAAIELRDFLRAQLEGRPYVTLTVASGLGYVVAGGPPSRLSGLLLGLGSRLTLELFVRDLIRAPTPAASPASPTVSRDPAPVVPTPSPRADGLS